ncbi:aminopeptidase N-like isoform X2 [Cataglyphis hispanica]|uniref:aminopeptidase N-like isoform X2 n=1 Tax=Cataglyphis hispanica TaxID=1086592 RepID=UPI00217FFD64|nr:aminopeptidase N-like isoform X2 [Cataglyphis hispanica]
MLLYTFICIYIFTFIEADTAIIPESNDKEINYRLPGHTKPLFYDIKLNPHLEPDNFMFDGEVLVSIKILSSTRTLMLHTKELIIDENATFLKTADEFNFYIPTTHHHNNLTEMLSLKFDENLLTGYYILYLKFTGILNDRSCGFYRSSYTNDAKNTVWFAATNFMATYARAAFPCWDEPALKAVFKIAIKHHTNYMVLSNMPICKKSKIDENDGKIWTHFEESPVISTYLVSFLVSDFRNIRNSDGTINVWGRNNIISLASFAHEVAQKAAIELERYTNHSSVRVAKIDHVALPGLSDKAIESWGLITYKETTILYDEDSSPIDKLCTIATNIIHQTTYQWFGNTVSPTWWTHIWINKGLTEYFTYHIIDKIYKDWQLVELSISKTLFCKLIINSMEYVQPLNLEPNTPEEINSKSSVLAFPLLRMLSHCLSDNVFHTGVVKYFEKHKYGVANVEDLWSALQDAFDESAMPENKFKIQEVMDTWIRQKGYPFVTVIRDQSKKIKITQEYFRPDEKERACNNTATINQKWWIPINFASRTNPDFSTTLATHWLSPEVEELIIEDINPQDWIIVNIQQTGFYRVNYDPTNWLRIANYLDSENYTKIHVLNRAQIISDASYLMLSHKLDPRIFMDITKYLRRETNYIVWFQVFKRLSKITKFFLFNEGEELFKPYVLDLMNNIIETVGIQDHPNDDYFTKVIRDAILKDTCFNDHPLCLREAHAQLINYLENPTLANTALFQKKEWIFCNGIKQANETIWNKLLFYYINTNKSEFTLYYLGCSKNLTIIKKFLNMTISEDSPIAKKDILYVIYSTIFGYFPNITLDFIINNWNKLATIYRYARNTSRDLADLFSHIAHAIYTKKQIEKIKAFLGKLEVEVPETIMQRERNIEMMETIIKKICLWLEQRNLNLSTNSTSQDIR